MVLAPIAYYADVDGDVVITGYHLLYGGIVYIHYSGLSKSTDVGNGTVSGNKSYYYYSIKNIELDYDIQDVIIKFYAYNENDEEILYKTITVSIEEGKNHIDIVL
jgi:hypothetical protein